MLLRIPRGQRGFTLVELMVGAVLAMLVLGAVAVLFAQTSFGRSEVERSGRLTENAAYALELVTEGDRSLTEARSSQRENNKMRVIEQ